MNLDRLGWNEFFEEQFGKFREQGFVAARISQEHRNLYLAHCEVGEVEAEVSGKFRHGASSRGDYPSVGDWVAISIRSKNDRATIHAVLKRKTGFSRKAVLSGGMPETGGKTEEQVLAANIDTALLVSGLDGDFNLRRIERYLAVAWDSGANPVIILNKADVCPDLDEAIADVESIAVGVPIHAISATEKTRLDELRQYLDTGKTVVLLGSSGVGKSTIINSLLGDEVLETQDVREDDSRGRHTTTHREMILLQDGGIVIDTPGMREIQMWGDEGGVSRVFEDVEEFAEQCRFSDCKHQSEPGCAVRQAIEAGDLDPKRFRNYEKLQKELAHIARRKSKKLEREDQRKFDKRIRLYLKERQELKDKGLL